jgi:NAD+ synthase (glutamine-hydrolysing)
MRRFRVSLAQINPTVGEIEGNVRRIIDDIGRARALGADLIAFPELAVTGYPPEDLLFKSAFIEANLAGLRDIAKAGRELSVVVGFVDKQQDIYNAAAVIHDGALAGVYHKQFLPNYGVFDENRYFQAGREAPVFTLGETCFGVNICEDIWYPTGPTTRQAPPSTPARRSSASGWWPRGRPTTSSAWLSSTWWAARTSSSSTAAASSSTSAAR